MCLSQGGRSPEWGAWHRGLEAALCNAGTATPKRGSATIRTLSTDATGTANSILSWILSQQKPRGFVGVG